jgi:hypothetical protein
MTDGRQKLNAAPISFDRWRVAAVPVSEQFENDKLVDQETMNESIK